MKRYTFWSQAIFLSRKTDNTSHFNFLLKEILLSAVLQGHTWIWIHRHNSSVHNGVSVSTIPSVNRVQTCSCLIRPTIRNSPWRLSSGWDLRRYPRINQPDTANHIFFNVVTPIRPHAAPRWWGRANHIQKVMVIYSKGWLYSSDNTQSMKESSVEMVNRCAVVSLYQGSKAS